METTVKSAKQTEMSNFFTLKKNGQNVGDIVIPEEHKQIVRERIKKYETSPDCYLSWNDIECKMETRK
jgi:hypothetical protein